MGDSPAVVWVPVGAHDHKYKIPENWWEEHPLDLHLCPSQNTSLSNGYSLLYHQSNGSAGLFCACRGALCGGRDVASEGRIELCELCVLQCPSRPPLSLGAVEQIRRVVSEGRGGELCVCRMQHCRRAPREVRELLGVGEDSDAGDGEDSDEGGDAGDGEDSDDGGPTRTSLRPRPGDLLVCRSPDPVASGLFFRRKKFLTRPLDPSAPAFTPGRAEHVCLAWS